MSQVRDRFDSVPHPRPRFFDEAMASSARQFAEMNNMLKNHAEAVRKKNERDQKAAEATIELDEQTKVQNELLRQQLREARASVKSSRIWNWVMFAVALAGVIVGIVGVTVARAK